MVSKISHGSSLSGALAYNQKKVDKGKGKVLASNLVIEPADGRFNAFACAQDFERFMPSHKRTKKPVVHISLNPHPDDKLTDVQLADIGREYRERLGYGGQPYMIFKHEDINRQHIHLVTTRVRQDGSLVPDKFQKDRSNRIIQQLESEYKLIPAKGNRQSEIWQLSPVDASGGNLKSQVANVIKLLSEMYSFQSLGEYRALLSLYNIGIEKVEGSNKGHRYMGLVYSALDTEGKRAGKPLKSSLFGKSQGIVHLEERMKKSGETIKSGKIAETTKTAISGALKTCHTESTLRKALQEKGIDMVLRRSDTGRIYGATFIDHNTRTVLNGSRMGKKFSANALNELFADNSHREDLHTPSIKTPHSQNNPIANHQDMLPMPDFSGITETAGNLFSILTPDIFRQHDSESLPKRRRKKKKKYGRQI